MSMWDTLALYIVLDDPGIVLKRELLRIPFYGWYLWKAAAISIDRGAGADALIRPPLPEAISVGTHGDRRWLGRGRRGQATETNDRSHLENSLHLRDKPASPN